MTDEERISRIEKIVRNFNIVTDKTAQIQGGFQNLGKSLSISDRLSQIEKVHDNFRIIGGANMKVEGSLRTGYCISSTCPDTGAIEGSGGISPPPPISTGACCVGSNCTIETESGCNDIGGVYHGNGTVCDPNPCGACCIAPFFADPFYGGNGLYYPIQVTPRFCFPNGCGHGPPCSPCVPCWFGTPVDPGTRYGTLTIEWDGCTNPNPVFGDCISTGAIVSINSYDADCSFTTECSGSISYSGGLCDGFPNQDCTTGDPDFFTSRTETLSNPCS